MYQVGEHIIYGNNGVCRVESIGPMKMGGEEKTYYTLVPIYARNSKLFTPVDNAKVVMRPVLSKEETDRLIDDIQNIEILGITDEKHREDAYKETMRTCDCADWIKLIKTLYLRKAERLSRGKKATSSDEKYLHMAEDNLYGELAFSLNTTKDRIEEFVVTRIVETV